MEKEAMKYVVLLMVSRGCDLQKQQIIIVTPAALGGDGAHGKEGKEKVAELNGFNKLFETIFPSTLDIHCYSTVV